MALIVDTVAGAGTEYSPRRGPKDFAQAGYCGRSFNEGLLRFHDTETAPHFRELAVQAFPQILKIDKKADVLAFDWRGNQYLTAKMAGQSDPVVLHADLATAELNMIASVPEFAAALTAPNVA